MGNGIHFEKWPPKLLRDFSKFHLVCFLFHRYGLLKKNIQTASRRECIRGPFAAPGLSFFPYLFVFVIFLQDMGHSGSNQQMVPR